jgi:hypothetical protein
MQTGMAASCGKSSGGRGEEPWIGKGKEGPWDGSDDVVLVVGRGCDNRWLVMEVASHWFGVTDRSGGPQNKGLQQS